MKTLILAVVLTLAAGSAHAASCNIEAKNKNLAGAAKSSFLKKCETDASASCDKKAADQKLAGAAKTSFTKKCVTEAVN